MHGVCLGLLPAEWCWFMWEQFNTPAAPLSKLCCRLIPEVDALHFFNHSSLGLKQRFPFKLSCWPQTVVGKEPASLCLSHLLHSWRALELSSVGYSMMLINKEHKRSGARGRNQPKPSQHFLHLICKQLFQSEIHINEIQQEIRKNKRKSTPHKVPGWVCCC